MKKIIKSLTAAVVIGGVFAAGQSAFAQSTFIGNDLYMGFQNQGGGQTADYIVNMGPVGNIVGGSSVVPLSSDFSESDFKSAALQGTNELISCGVVGATNSPTAANPSDVYVTELRSGGAGNPALAGSTAPAALTKSQDNGAESALTQLNAPASGQGILDTSLSWDSDVTSLVGSSFVGEIGDNPDSLLTGSGVVYEDLWYTTNSTVSDGAKPFTYLGYFTVNVTGSSPVVTFTPKAAPAPLTGPDITSVTYSGTTVTLTWTTLPPHSYQLQYTTSLNPPITWNNVGGSLPASTGTLTESDTAASGAHRFYRVTGQ
jgi:hypothetical protein